METLNVESLQCQKFHKLKVFVFESFQFDISIKSPDECDSLLTETDARGPHQNVTHTDQTLFHFTVSSSC